MIYANVSDIDELLVFGLLLLMTKSKLTFASAGVLVNALFFKNLVSDIYSLVLGDFILITLLRDFCFLKIINVCTSNK